MVERKEYDPTKGYLEDAPIVSKHHEATPRKLYLEVMQHDYISGLRHEVEDAPDQPALDEYKAMKEAGTLNEDVLYVAPAGESVTIPETTETTTGLMLYSAVTKLKGISDGANK